jgi:hypothetical protein
VNSVSHLRSAIYGAMALHSSAFIAPDTPENIRFIERC